MSRKDGHINKRDRENKVKKASDDIDELFGAAIKSKEETEQERKVQNKNKVNAKEDTEDEQKLMKRKKKKKSTLVEGDAVASRSVAHHGIIGTPFIISPEAPLERIDGDSGLPVYKAHLLKVGEGGGTELCPFDCNCCF